MTDQDKISQAILQTARVRGPAKTTCPSEIARELFPENWRGRMSEIRKVAIALHISGEVVLMQKGHVIDPDAIKGPIRIKIKARI